MTMADDNTTDDKTLLELGFEDVAKVLDSFGFIETNAADVKRFHEQWMKMGKTGRHLFVLCAQQFEAHPEVFDNPAAA
jgi:citrate lyase synthetase